MTWRRRIVKPVFNPVFRPASDTGCPAAPGRAGHSCLNVQGAEAESRKPLALCGVSKAFAFLWGQRTSLFTIGQFSSLVSRAISTGRVPELGAPFRGAQLSSRVGDRGPTAASAGSKQSQHSPAGAHGVPNSCRQPSWDWQLSRCSQPTGLPLSPLPTHSTSCCGFSLSKISCAFQAPRKKFRVCKWCLGNRQGSTARTSRHMVHPCISDLIFMIAWPGMHLFTVNKLSGHVTKVTFGSICDPQSKNLLKLVVQRKFSVTPSLPPQNTFTSQVQNV